MWDLSKVLRRLFDRVETILQGPGKHIIRKSYLVKPFPEKRKLYAYQMNLISRLNLTHSKAMQILQRGNPSGFAELIYAYDDAMAGPIKGN